MGFNIINEVKRGKAGLKHGLKQWLACSKYTKRSKRHQNKAVSHSRMVKTNTKMEPTESASSSVVEGETRRKNQNPCYLKYKQ